MKDRFCIYIRTSEKNHKELLKKQEEALMNYVEEHHGEVSGIFCDDGYSGIDMERPGLQELIRNVQDGQADVVLVHTIDRLCRRDEDLISLRDIFQQYHCEIRSMNENVESFLKFYHTMKILDALEEEQKEEMGLEAYYDSLDEDYFWDTEY